MSASIPETGAIAQMRAARAADEKEEKKEDDAPKTFGSELATYLASDAASWISGQLLLIREDRLELDKGWHADRVLMNRGGKAWTAEDLVTGVPKLVGTGPVGLIEFLGH